MSNSVTNKPKSELIPKAMTFTQASEHNKQFDLFRHFRDPKKITDGPDGSRLKWVKDPLGKIGFVKSVRPSDGFILIFYPIKSLKQSYDLSMQQWAPEDWPNFTLLKEGY